MTINLTPVCGYCTAAATRVHRDATDELLCARCARQQCEDWRTATRPISAADVRRYNGSIADVAIELLADERGGHCQLFTLCVNAATGVVHDELLGDFPGCQRCADKLSLTLVPFAAVEPERPAAVVELLVEARQMMHGDRMLKRYASRQGWTCDSGDEDERLLDAAVFLAAAGRTFGDVLRAAS